MYKILRKEFLNPITCLMEVEAPRVARAAKPGQFLIVRATSDGERVPLTVCDYDREKGTVTIVIQIIGASSRIICSLEEGSCMADVVGPLGQPSEFMHQKHDSEGFFIKISKYSAYLLSRQLEILLFYCCKR